MTTVELATGSVPPRTGVLLRLAWLESRRLMATPWLLAVPVFTALLVRAIRQPDWSGAVYGSAQMLAGPYLAAVSVLIALACLRDRSPLVEDAPVTVRQRIVARMLAGVPFVVVMAAVVAPAAVWLRSVGGLDLGDEPGRTLHAHFTLPELLQPVVLTALVVTLGAAVARLVRNRLGAATVLFVLWFVSSLMYWAVNGPAARFFALVQSQPVVVRVGPVDADPASFPASWLLAAPGQYQDYWGRVVVSPSLAAWHDVYLLGLTALFAGFAVRGRSGRLLMVGGLLVAVAGVVLQKAVHP
jgi:hypothetical protein